MLYIPGDLGVCVGVLCTLSQGIIWCLVHISIQEGEGAICLCLYGELDVLVDTIEVEKESFFMFHEAR